MPPEINLLISRKIAHISDDYDIVRIEIGQYADGQYFVEYYGFTKDSSDEKYSGDEPFLIAEYLGPKITEKTGQN